MAEELKATAIPDTSIWYKGIYCLQTTDAALGYNATTGLDGPANQQWIQLTGAQGIFVHSLQRAIRKTAIMHWTTGIFLKTRLFLKNTLLWITALRHLLIP